MVSCVFIKSLIDLVDQIRVLGIARYDTQFSLLYRLFPKCIPQLQGQRSKLSESGLFFLGKRNSSCQIDLSLSHHSNVGK